jgi:hypothetical protein
MAAVGVGIGGLWSSIKVGTWTDAESLEMALRRARNSPLEVEIDTEWDVDSSSSVLFQPFLALMASMGSVHRWRSLTILSFPEDQQLLRAGVPMEAWKVRENLLLESLKVSATLRRVSFYSPNTRHWQWQERFLASNRLTYRPQLRLNSFSVEITPTMSSHYGA